ncbi:MAG: hypothetical protein ABI867_22825 [Kofleriaceae bacterium]
MHARFAILTLLLGSGCLDEPDTADRAAYIGSDDDGPVYPDGNTGASVCKTISASGKVFYNDLRSQGRHALRDSPTGAPGARDSYDPAGTNTNYLGLLDAQIDIYEIDNHSAYITDPDCVTAAVVGSTTIAADGSWSWSGQVCDACNIDFEGTSDTQLSIAAKVSLRKCDHPSARCFSVRDPGDAPETHTAHFADGWDGVVRSRWIRGASATTPMTSSNTAFPMGTDYFQASSSQSAGVVTDVDAQAASVFATLVDVTRKVHLEGNVPFDYDRWGEVKAFYPDVLSGTHSHQASRMCVDEPDNIWFTGWDAAHEYGHLVHYRRWDGVGKWVDLCYSEIEPTGGRCNENDTVDGEYNQGAFKEGWADFIGKVTFEDTESSTWATCGDEYTPLGGTHFKDDVTHALCYLRGSGGFEEQTPTQTQPFLAARMLEFGISLQTLEDQLPAMWLGVSSTTRASVIVATQDNPVHVALGICEFAQHLVGSGQDLGTVEDQLARASITCDF